MVKLQQKSGHQLKHSDYFANELALKQLVSSGRVSIVYIHGTARSGSTIAEIIISQLVDFAIHQPFRGVLQKSGGRFRCQKLEFDADIYDSACGLIVEQINRHLQKQEKVTVVIKELAGFFKPSIWRRWLEIPEQFLFTIRDPHLQYMSWLSAMTDKIFRGEGKLQEQRDFVIDKAAITETSILTAEWEGTTISCNQAAWNALVRDFKQVKKAISGTSKKLAILDSVLLRYKPEYAMKQILAKLDFPPAKIAELNLNFLSQSAQKVWDIRDKNRPMVRKANNSKTINPLKMGEAVSIDVFPPKSQAHIRQLIPLYLDLLSAPEQVYLPSLAEIEGTKDDALIATHPFMAYAIATLDLQRQNRPLEKISSCLNVVAEDKPHQKSINFASLRGSLEIVNSYWQKTETEIYA